MGGGVANATEKNTVKKELLLILEMKNQLFTEGGVEFYLFVDGQFDFNARSYGRDNL
jgi:hypothetical protein